MAQKGAKMQTDEQLVQLVQQGSESAETELFSRYKYLVTKICRGYFIVGGDIEDLTQEGMIGLYKAIKSFTPDKDASFKTFASVCIKHQVQVAIKSANTTKNRPLSSAVSFQSFQSDPNSSNFDYLPVELVLETTPAEKVIDKENYTALKTLIKSILSKNEYKVLALYLQGYSYKEISQKLNITKKSIDNSLTRIKTKLRAKLSEKI